MSPEFFGLDSSELAARVGTFSQLARIDSFTVDNGPGRGTRVIRVISGGGLEVELHPDRALDVGRVTFQGVPYAWISPTEINSPFFYDSSGIEWLRTFGGGLLATCGLDSFGPPSEDNGVSYPMHGRIGTVPAKVTATTVTDTELVVEAEIRQTRVFGENLLLKRRYTFPLGGTGFKLEDEVCNQGLSDTGVMVLYHVNLGWPILSENSKLTIPSNSTKPRDAEAESGIQNWAEIEKPQAGYKEQVFLHDFAKQDSAKVAVENPQLGFGFQLEFDPETLPALHQWKMMGEGHYVLGLEPANTLEIFGRAQAKKNGNLPILKQNETVRYTLNFGFSNSVSNSEAQLNGGELAN